MKPRRRTTTASRSRAAPAKAPAKLPTEFLDVLAELLANAVLRDLEERRRTNHQQHSEEDTSEYKS